MEINPKDSLKKAGILIKEGRTKSARAILLDILRQDQENAQAWFMLSYTIPDLEKQIQAAQHALRLKPDSEKARKRLEQLSGQRPIEQPIIEETISEEADEVEEYSGPIFPSTPATEDEQEDPEIPDDDAPTTELDPLVALRGSVKDYSSYQTSEEKEPEFTPRVDEIKKEIQEKEEQAKVFGIKRSHFLIGAAALVIIAALIALITQNLRAAWSAYSIEATATATPTLVRTAEPTATQTQDEPTNTPIPTELHTPTPQAPAQSDSLRWDQLSPPSGILQGKFDSATTQLLEMIGADIEPAFKSYTVTELDLQELIRSVSNLSGFDQQVSNTHQFYQVLGLADGSEDFESLYANFWADPNGTLAIPEEQSIAIFGYEFSEYQQFSYAQGAIQLLRYAQFPDAPLYQVEFPCYLPAEKCDIWNAVIKGEAAFTAKQWASEQWDQTALQNLEETNTKSTFTSISPLPTDLMQTLIDAPYQIGYKFAEAVYEAEGWAGLEKIYTNPPKSTAQVLHPDKYLAGDEPSGVIGDDLGDFLGGDWEPMFKGPIGEWKTFLMLTRNPNPHLQLDQQTAQQATSGWKGDLTQIFSSASGQNVVLFHWLWDTAGEQSQFEFVLREHASKMVGGLESQVNGFDCEKSATQTSCIIAFGEETIWLLTPDMETASQVLENYSPIPTE